MRSTFALQYLSHLVTYVYIGNEDGRLESRPLVHRDTNNYYAPGSWQRTALYL